MLLGPTPNNEANLRIVMLPGKEDDWVESLRILWIIFSCKNVSLSSGVSSFSSDDILFEIHVRNELFGTTACVSFITSVSMTRGPECVEAVLEKNDDVTYVRFPSEAGVGQIEYTVRIHNGVIKDPHGWCRSVCRGILVCTFGR